MSWTPRRVASSCFKISAVARMSSSRSPLTSISISAPAGLNLPPDERVAGVDLGESRLVQDGLLDDPQRALRPGRGRADGHLQVDHERFRVHFRHENELDMAPAPHAAR